MKVNLTQLTHAVKLELVDAWPAFGRIPPGFKEASPYNLVPALDAGDVKLCESLAIARYICLVNGDKAKLLGETPAEQAKVEQWMSCVS